jgi:hypothetical protein
MARPRFLILSRPIQSAPTRFPWMGIAAALMILLGACVFSFASTPLEGTQQTVALAYGSK